MKASQHVTGKYQHTGPETIPRGPMYLAIKRSVGNSYASEYVVAAQDTLTGLPMTNPLDSASQQEMSDYAANVKAREDRTYHNADTEPEVAELPVQSAHPDQRKRRFLVPSVTERVAANLFWGGSLQPVDVAVQYTGVGPAVMGSGQIPREIDEWIASTMQGAPASGTTTPKFGY